MHRDYVGTPARFGGLARWQQARTRSIRDEAVAAAKFQDGAITEAKIADIQIGFSQLADQSAANFATNYIDGEIAFGLTYVETHTVTLSKVEDGGFPFIIVWEFDTSGTNKRWQLRNGTTTIIERTLSSISWDYDSWDWTASTRVTPCWHLWWPTASASPTFTIRAKINSASGTASFHNRRLGVVQLLR
jgi:hypothetical protein